jgi:N-acetylneuraminic acid mutarotase
MNFDRNALRIALLMMAMASSTQVFCQPSGQWIWQGDDNVPGTTGVYGTKGVASAGNRPCARESYAWCKDASGSFWMFGGTDAYSNTYNDLWEYNPSTRQWTWVSGSSTPNINGQFGIQEQAYYDYDAWPGARQGAIMGYDNVHGLYWFFGGNGYDVNGTYGFLNDLWEYDPGTQPGHFRTWKWVAGSRIANQYGLYGAPTGKTPGGRSNPVGGIDSHGNLWIFGGNGYDGQGILDYLNDVWEFDYNDHYGTPNAWIWKGGDSTADSYGNYNKKGTTSAGSEPGSRFQSFGWMDSQNNLWVFGGYGYGSNYQQFGYMNDLWKFSGGSWTWMSGSNDATLSNDANLSGVYGAQGIPAAANTPGGRIQPFGALDPTGNLLLFGGSGYDGSGAFGDLDDCWKYNPTTNQWTWINGFNTNGHAPLYPPAPGDVKTGSDPGGRSQGGAWTDGAGNLWIMGGFSIGPVVRNDLWQLNFNPSLTPSGEAGQWTWVGGPDTANSPEVLAGFDQPVNIEMPGARSGPSYGMDGQGYFWIFGGHGYDTKSDLGLLNDLWTYSPSGNTWNLARGSELVNQYGVYGQKGSAGPTNTPGSRSGQTGCFDKNSNFWVFGGKGYAGTGSSGGLNDLWELPHARPPWDWVSGSNATRAGASYGTIGVAASGNTPGYRTSSSSAVDGSGNIWIFGGLGEDGNGDTAVDLNDLWKYNPVAKQWTWMAGGKVGKGAPVYTSSGGDPGAREGASSWFDAAGNYWLFGGFDSTYGYFNDLWEFTPASGTWKWIGGDQNSSNVVHPGVYGTMGTAASTNMPGARRSPAFALDAAGNVWLFGGTGYDIRGWLGVLGDLWKYSPTSGQWTWMGGDNTISTGAVYGIMGSGNLGNKPGSRLGSAAWIDRSGNFWLMGGSDFAGQYHNDLWKFTSLTPVSLPIEEVTLEGQAGQNENNLTWQTIDELNTAGFEVERSIDGTNFADIGSVTAVGSGNNSYSFTDNQLPPSSKYFYRLKMSDKDGTVTYSQTIVLYTVAAAGLSVYPNPTHGSIILRLKDNSLLNTPLKLLSIDGRLIRQYLITEQQQQLDLTGLSNGVYLLQFTNGSTVKVLKE